MPKDMKIMIGGIILTFLLVIGLAYLQGGNEEAVLTDIGVIQTSPQNYDLGNVPINGGLVTREYEVTNESEDSVKLAKIATSCMCTQAKVITSSKETRFYGMEHATDKNPPVNVEIASGETARVAVNFDPAAHGPQGTGAFDRAVTLTFSDPKGVKTLKFFGTVVK